MSPMAALKPSRSLTDASAALASSPNLANLALKSAIFSQILGSAAVSPPVFELSGNRAGILAAASSNVAKILWAAAKSNGASPLFMADAVLAASPFAFISALRAAIGSCWAVAATTPSAMAATANTVRIIMQYLPSLLLQRQTPALASYSSVFARTCGLFRGLRRILPSLAAPRPELGDGAGDNIEHRRKDQAERGHPDHAEEHRGAERLSQFRAGADRPDQRRHAEDEGKRGHQDRTQ